MSSRIIRPAASSDSPSTAPRVTRFRLRSTGPTPVGVETADREQSVFEQNSTEAAGAEILEPETVQQRCEKMLQDARLKVSEIEKLGYEKGFAEGQRAGSEVGERMGEALVKQYSAGLDAINKLRRDVFAASEREVIRLALEVARKVIKREVAIDEELILTLVRVALARVADQSLATVRVNPKDFQVIQRHHAADGNAGALSESVKLVEDPLIARGGCIIETESGTIDARVEEQLREIEKGFFE